MRLKLMQYNVQDLFLQLDFPLSLPDLARLTEGQWQLTAAPDVMLKPLANVRGLARAILEEGPDVVMLNEVGGPASLANFARLFLADAYVPLLLPGRAARGIDNGFLVRRGLPLRAEVRSHRGVPAPFRYPHEADPEGHPAEVARAASLALRPPAARTLSRDVAELRLYAGQRDAPVLAMLLAHLKSAYDPDGIDPGGVTCRAAEVRALLGVYARVCAALGPGTPVLLAGDMNDNASRQGTAPAFRPLYEATDLEDALEVAGRLPYERMTHLTFFLDEVSARQLDYIFIPAALRPRLVSQQTYVHRYRFAEDQVEIALPLSLRERALLPSDHYPVIATLDLDLERT